MKCTLTLLLISCYIGIDAYPDVRVDQGVSGWRASGSVHYAWCSRGNFELEFGQHFEESRGACLVIRVTAMLIKGNESVRTDPDYTSSGTAYSHFEIVEGGRRFCVQRVGTRC